MARVLVVLPLADGDPTEAAVPWWHLAALGHDLRFATPDGTPARADPRMLHGTGLGLLAPLLRADVRGRTAYAAMAASPAFLAPLRWHKAHMGDFDALLLPGGHAKGMRPYLESPLLQRLVVQAFDADKVVGAICHGVVLAARSRRADGRSVLHGRRTTALTRSLELTAWWLTRAWLGDYYRTYPQTVQSEVTAALARAEDFEAGPPALRRDAPARLGDGFIVRDGNYVSARWPGDAHRFAQSMASLLEPAAGVGIEPALPQSSHGHP